MVFAIAPTGCPIQKFGHLLYDKQVTSHNVSINGHVETSRHLAARAVTARIANLQKQRRSAGRRTGPILEETPPVGVPARPRRTSMSHCDKMVDAGRRRFLGGAGFAAAGAAVATMVPGQGKAGPGGARGG